ncbi:alpha-ketoglutarate-dependent dioxygenase AlkB family protein [Sinisalibacter lacisalsi]|uniref:Alkylated DNA repair dioxygenase n=1 Tax=Sinisalibacter lacisalsi TaxID=1526570 RepID=A0ABQ1QAH3_9RHOB|nr:alpha-ketoglutarate-dependent dioxygenase AlkB [Sinisalibacter lacisalsi]GGD19745.1 alkylated DNA repair dioxygenase [Sinisalibacter lacisalsi]
MTRNDGTATPALMVRSARLYRGFLGPVAQADLAEALRGVVAAAPLFSPETRWGRKMSVRMTSAGRYGWYSDRRGYRYIDHHPSGTPWPAIPEQVREVWRAVAPDARAPDCCLVNFYGGEAKMGMHQDRDEADFSQPVVSISLGDEGLFRIGGTERGGSTESVWLASGDVLVLDGPARLAFHGIDRIRAGSSTLLKEGGRINLTLRVVD